MRHIKLHAARHTCATLMHLQGVPVAVIAAWIGHKDATLTLRLYAHSQDEAAELLVIAAALGVPPLQLLFPGELDDEVEMLPGQRTPTFHAKAWFTGGLRAAGATLDRVTSRRVFDKL